MVEAPHWACRGVSRPISVIVSSLCIVEYGRTCVNTLQAPSDSSDAMTSTGLRVLNNPSEEEAADITSSGFAYIPAILVASVRQSDSSSWLTQGIHPDILYVQLTR